MKYRAPFIVSDVQNVSYATKMLNKRIAAPVETASADNLRKVRFLVYGEEIIEKEVKLNGNSGRVYLPPDWVGRKIKVIRID